MRPNVKTFVKSRLPLHQIQLGQIMLKKLLHFLPPTSSPAPPPHHVYIQTRYRAIGSPGQCASIHVKSFILKVLQNILPNVF